MELRDLALALDLALAEHQDKGGDPDDPNTLVLTLLTPTTRGMGIRPIILETREDGTRVVGITAAVATRWRKKIGPALLVADRKRRQTRLSDNTRQR